jgi:glycosyltransferase involved in cell wall biosynthesis
MLEASQDEVDRRGGREAAGDMGNGEPAPLRRVEPGTTPDPSGFTYSIVIPVYNSVGVVGTTIDTVTEVFEAAGLRHQVVLVNDGSRDGSWEVIAERARSSPHVVALNLLRNYGQHHANLAGMRESTGDYVITMDDDLQNPPDQALLLIEKAMQGHDVVFGRFEQKQAAGYRRLGSRLISAVNRRIFDQPPGLAVSNFRILRRDVVERICGSRTAHPYITGQALMFSHNPADVTVRHEARTIGTSNYGMRRITSLVLAILFSYSVFPLRAAAGIGFAVATGSFLLGLFYLVRSVFVESHVPGWTTIAVLLALLNGVVIMLLSMLGEYVVRTLNAVSVVATYHVTERVSS